MKIGRIRRISGICLALAIFLQGHAARAATWVWNTTSGAANQFDEFFSGKGIITVIPEPPVWALAFAGAGLLVGVQHWRRKKA